MRRCLRASPHSSPPVNFFLFFSFLQMSIRFLLFVLANVFVALACRWSSACRSSSVATLHVLHAPLAPRRRRAHFMFSTFGAPRKSISISRIVTWLHWMLSHSAIHALNGNIIDSGTPWSDFFRLVKKGPTIDKGTKWKKWREERGALKTFPTFISGREGTEMAQDKRVFGDGYARVVSDMALLWSNVSSFASAHFLHLCNTISLEDLARLVALPVKLDEVLNRIVRFHYSLLANGAVTRYESKHKDAKWAHADPILHTEKCDVAAYGAPDDVPRFTGTPGKGLLEGNAKGLQSNMARVHSNVLRRAGFFLHYVVGARLTEEERSCCTPAQLLSLCSSVANEKVVVFSRPDPRASASKSIKKDDLFNLLKVPGTHDETGRVEVLRVPENGMESCRNFIIVRPGTRRRTAVTIDEAATVVVFLQLEPKKPSISAGGVFKSKYGAYLVGALKARAQALRRGTAFRVLFCEEEPKEAAGFVINNTLALPALADKEGTRAALQSWAARVGVAPGTLEAEWSARGLILDWEEHAGALVLTIFAKINNVVAELVKRRSWKRVR